MKHIFYNASSKVKIAAVHVLLTFAISWLIWLPVIFFVPERYSLPFLLLGSFGPFIAAITVKWKTEGKGEMKKWLRESFTFKNRIFWLFFAGFIFPLIIGALHHSLYLLWGGKSGFTWDQRWSVFIINLILTSLVGGGNEEPGWRGYLTPLLMNRFKPVITCIMVGIIWVCWHLPLYFLKSWSGGDQPIFLFILYAIPLSMILTWLYYKSKLSIIPAMLLHSATNIVFGYFPRPDVIIQSLSFDFNVLKAISYWIIAIILLIITKGNLGFIAVTEKNR